MDQFIYGKQPVSELLRSKVRIERVFTTEPFAEPAVALRKLGTEIVVLTKAEFTKRFANQVHQGIAAQVGAFQYRDEAWLLKQPVTKESLVVMLDGIEDPQNLGAIARSALAAGANALLVRKDRQALVTPAAIKASAGYLLHLDVVLFTNAVSVTKALKKLGYWVVGATGDAKTNYQAVDPHAPLVVVIGNEHTGIARLLGEHLDFPVAIQMAPGVDSLNAASAAAVILLDLYNRRRKT